MTQRIKVGNVYVELPRGTETGLLLGAPPSHLIPEKPDTPEPLEEPQYIYRPNDPFRASIDEARAIASITSSHKPWVKKTWFVIFVIGPLLYGELFALSLALKDRGVETLKTFFLSTAAVFPLWLIYFTIWWRKVRRPRRKASNADG